MRIVQVSVGSMRIPPREGGAPLQVIFNTSKHLSKMGQEVIVLDSRYSKDDSTIDYIDELKIVRLNSLKVPIPGLAHMPRYIVFAFNELNTVLFALKVSRYLEKNKSNIDVIHLHLTSVGVILSILNRKLRNKMYYTSHIGQWMLRGSKKLTLLEKIHINFDAYLMKRVAKVIALNDSARDSFVSISKVPTDRVVVVNNGVDTDFFNPSINVEETKAKYRLDGKLVILFVGQLTKIKGAGNFVKAANIIVNDFGYKNALFVLVGPLTFGTLEKPIDMDEMVTFIRNHNLGNNVIFTNILPIEEVRKFYVASDIFVLPSLAEGDPLVVTEAMACGKPVIGTKVGGIPKKVRDGWNGFLVDPANEQQVADRIKYLIDNPEERRRMGANSRTYAEEEYDWRKVAERLLQLYQNM